MSATTTIYDVKVRYGLEDRGTSSGLKSIADHAERASVHSGGLLHSLKEVAAVAGVGLGIHELKKSFIDWNASMESLKISMGAVIQMNMGGTFKSAQSQASALFEEFQKFSQVTPLTTKQLIEFSNSISGATLSSGGSMKDLVDLTERGAVAAKVLGFNAEIAGVQIQEMLMGNVNKRERFAQQLLMPYLAKRGQSIEDFKKMDMGGRRNALVGALKDPGLMEATKGMEKSFDGVVSTFKDKLELALGKTGLPLFKALTREVERWNGWIDKNEKSIAEFGHDFGLAMESGFTMLKDGVGFLAENKDTIKLLAEIYLGFKVFKFGAGLATAASELITSFTSISSASSLLGISLAGPGGLVAILGGAVVAIAAYEATVEAMDRKKKLEFQTTLNAYAKYQAGDKSVTSRYGMAREVFTDMFKHKFAPTEAQAEAIYRSPQLLADKIAAQMGYAGKELADASNAIITSTKLFHDPEEFKSFLKDLYQEVDAAAHPGLDGTNPNKFAEHNTNVTINKIEVASDDPDRFVFGLVRSFKDIAKNPNQARDAIRQG